MVIAAQLARALAHLHRRGVVHRAVRADHVILLSDGGVRLIGLGHARGGERQDEPVEAAFFPETAPELAQGAQADEKTDIYALGVTCFRMFAGDYPRNRALSELRSDLPSWLRAAIASAMADNPDQRPEDAYEFVYELERHGADKAARRRAGNAFSCATRSCSGASSRSACSSR